MDDIIQPDIQLQMKLCQRKATPTESPACHPDSYFLLETVMCARRFQGRGHGIRSLLGPG